MTVVVAPNGERKSYPLSGIGAPHSIGPVQGSIPILGRDFTALSYETMYRRQPWIYICVNKLASGVARLPIKGFAIDSSGNRERVRDHPAVNLLRHPWPRGSAYKLKEAIEGSLDIHGNALCVKFRGAGGVPEELWPIPWRAVRTEVSDSSLRVSRYVFRGERGEIPIAPEEVVHFTRYGAGGQVGTSPMEPLRATLQLEDAAQRWAASHFANGATPVGSFLTDKKLDPSSMGRLRAELTALYAGPENAGRFGIFDQGLKWQAIAQSAVDTALIEQKRLNREEVAAVYDMPQPMIGILDRATFSNITEQHKMLYMDCLGPRLTMIEETLMTQLITPDFGDGIFIEFDLAEVLKADIQARADAYVKLLAILSVNEIRQLENRPPIGDPNDVDNPANQPWMQTALAPILAGLNAVVPPKPADPAADTPAAAGRNGNGVPARLA